MHISDRTGGLIVSCQAPDDSPLRHTDIMVAMALAAIQGGARGIRAAGVDDVRAIARITDLPIIGLKKAPPLEPDRVFITPAFDDAAALVTAGASVIALDGTARERTGGEDLKTIISRIHDELGALVMADVDNRKSAEYAVACGADIVGTTLAGHTTATLGISPDAVDLDAIAEIAKAVNVPVLAEGRVWTPEDATAALAAGAAGIVVGSAITNPVSITRRFASAIENGPVPSQVFRQSLGLEGCQNEASKRAANGQLQLAESSLWEAASKVSRKVGTRPNHEISCASISLVATCPPAEVPFHTGQGRGGRFCRSEHWPIARLSEQSADAGDRHSEARRHRR